MQGGFKELEESVNSLSKALVKVTTEHSYQVDSLASEQTRRTELLGKIDEMQNTITAKQAKYQKLQEQYNDLDQRANAANERLKRLELYELTGATTAEDDASRSDAGAKSWADRVMGM
jgi:chromosome segregation ATPase